MEEVSKKVSRSERMNLLVKEIEKGTRGKTQYSVSPLMAHIADMMKLAYIAGANRKQKEIIDTGEILVDAINFTKDKGYSV